MTLPIPLELPVLPAPRERALLVLMNPDAALEGYLAVVEGDPALTAAVLRAANSALSAPVHPVRSAGDAVIRLGATEVRHLITATLVRSQFATVETAGLDADELWRHLLGCAVLAEAQAPDEETAREAFTLGLIHDLGRLAMAAQAPTRYRMVVDAAQEGQDASDAERHYFGISHAEFGRNICERWRLPDEISMAVGSHHGADPPADIPETEDTPPPHGTDVASRLTLARWIMRGLGVGDGLHRPSRRHPLAEQHPLVEALGGRAELMGSIRWFRDSTQGRQRTG
jgi:HD-like signal output (HDOD) protein